MISAPGTSIGHLQPRPRSSHGRGVDPGNGFQARVKAMRASGMDDVIFSGSGKRSARNAAEVTLVLRNDQRTAPPAFNDADLLGDGDRDPLV